jgi:hypothetical protein
MTLMRNYSYQLLAHLLNLRNFLTEEEKLDFLAEAYFLLMHATPYYCGSPAVVESFIDAYLRADLYKRLTHKKREPFWDVIFWDLTRGKYKGVDFLSNYD